MLAIELFKLTEELLPKNNQEKSDCDYWCCLNKYRKIETKTTNEIDTFIQEFVDDLKADEKINDYKMIDNLDEKSKYDGYIIDSLIEKIFESFLEKIKKRVTDFSKNRR